MTQVLFHIRLTFVIAVLFCAAALGAGAACAQAAPQLIKPDFLVADIIASGDGRLFLAAAQTDADGELTEGIGLWASDGTTAGTVQVGALDLPAGSLLSSPYFGIAQVNGVAIYPAYGEGGLGFWRSDGTEAGTVPLTERSPSFPVQRGPFAAPVFVQIGLFRVPLFIHASIGSTLFFANGADIWMTDGSAEGTAPVLSFDPLTIRAMHAVGTTLFIIAGDHSGEEGSLWTSAGTVAGTAKVADVPYDYLPRMATIGDQMFFTLGSTLWRSDGTAEGTGTIAGFDGGVGELAATTETLFFIVGSEYSSSPPSPELWKSDGTTAGTVRMHTFSSVSHLRAFDDQVFFQASYFGRPPAVWRSDGTRTAVLAADVFVSTGLATFTGHGPFAAIDDTLYFGTQRGLYAVPFGEPLSGSGPACSGDCNGDSRVSVDELVAAIGMALGRQAPSTCFSLALDADASGTMTIDEILLAVAQAVHGCPQATAADRQPAPRGDAR